MPQTERKLKLHLHRVSNEEYFSMKERLVPTSFLNKYKVQKRIIDQKEQEKYLKEKYPAVKKAYEQYSLMLKLAESGEL